MPLLFATFWFVHGSAWRVVVGLAILALWSWKFALAVSDAPRPSAGGLPVRDPDSHVDRIYDLLNDAHAMLQRPGMADVVAHSAHGILEPEHFRLRVKERNRVAAHGLVKEVTVEYDPDPTDPALEFMPVLRPSKGRLIDGFRVFGRSGSELRTLNSEESLIHSVAIARTLFDAAMGTANAAYDTWSLELYTAFQFCVGELVSIPNRRAADFDEELHRGQVRARVTELVESANGAPLAEASQQALANLAAFVGHMSTLYCIVAVVPRDERGLISYTESMPLGTRTELDGSSALHRRLEAWFQHVLQLVWGAMPKSLHFDLRKAGHCQSYHCELTVGHSMYIDQIVIIDRHSQPVRTERRGINLRNPHFRTSGEGTQCAHIYTRNMSNAVGDVVARVDVLERPAGSLLRALLLAVLVLASTVWLAAVAPSTKDIDLEKVGVLSLAASALPAVIGAMWAVAGRAHRDRVIANLSLFSAVVSACTILAALHLYADPHWLDYVATKYIPTLKNHQAWVDHALRWKTLVVLASYHVVAIGVALTVRIVRVRRLLQRALRPDLGTSVVRPSSLR